MGQSTGGKSPEKIKDTAFLADRSVLSLLFLAIFKVLYSVHRRETDVGSTGFEYLHMKLYT